MIFSARGRFGYGRYRHWDCYHDYCVFSIRSLSGLLLDSRWAADSPPDTVSIYLRVVSHMWVYLLVIAFVTYGLRGVGLAIIFVLVTQ